MGAVITGGPVVSNFKKTQLILKTRVEYYETYLEKGLR